MPPTTPSPLEYLAAFAIAFTAGILSAIGLTNHIERLTSKGANIQQENQTQPSTKENF